MGHRACVVALNWNGRQFVGDCLRSLFAQTYPDYRVIVVDNASTDGSAQMIADEFPEAHLIQLPENRHFARGMNAGFRAAMRDSECAYVALLNNDTRVDPDWLAELVRLMDPGVGSVASKLLFMDRPEVLNSTGLCIAPDGGGMDRGWNEPDEGQFDHANDVFGASAGAALYRSDLLAAIGLFDEDFLVYYEDLDLAWRARLGGWHARFAPRAVVYHKYSVAYGRGSALKTYLCERNRIWNLIQNYPWRHVALGVPWTAARVAAGPLPWNRGPTGGRPTGPSPSTARAMVRGRLDAYGGLRRALEKRRRRRATAKVDAATVGRWLRVYGVSLRDMVLA